MAKKSAMSKGYRKTVKKKPFLTKKEIIELVVIVAVLLVGFILFNVLYDDGYTKDAQPGDIMAYASDELRDRYKKLGVIGEVEGFTLAERAEDATPISTYVFEADDETNIVDSISVSGSFVNAEMLTNSTLAYMQASVDQVSEIQQTTVQGYDAYVFSYNYSEYDESLAAETAEVTEETTEAAEETTEAAEETTEAAEETAEAAEETAEAAEETAEAAEEPAPNKFNQNVNAYIAVDEGHTLCLHIYRKSTDESNLYLEVEELADFVQSYASAFTLVEKDA